MGRTVLLELQYLPSVAYFAVIASADKIVIESKEHFEKQSFRNRCQILTNLKVLDLSVPVHHQGKKILIENLEIDYVQKWQNAHWRSIETAYRKSPFFDYYSDPLKNIIYSGEVNLFKLNKQLLTICLKFLQIDTPIEFSTSYLHEPQSGVTDLRSAIHPKKSLSNLVWFQAIPYYQMFGKDFAPNLSIIDLLFCEGPIAPEVLKKTIAITKNY